MFKKIEDITLKEFVNLCDDHPGTCNDCPFDIDGNDTCELIGKIEDLLKKHKGETFYISEPEKEQEAEQMKEFCGCESGVCTCGKCQGECNKKQVPFNESDYVDMIRELEMEKDQLREALDFAEKDNRRLRIYRRIAKFILEILEEE